MAKKPDVCQIKLLLDAEEHRLVRIAAAAAGVAMSVFAKRVVLDAAARELDDLGVPSVEKSKLPRRKKRGG